MRADEAGAAGDENLAAGKGKRHVEGRLGERDTVELAKGSLRRLRKG